jgi:hypothetical protein
MVLNRVSNSCGTCLEETPGVFSAIGTEKPRLDKGGDARLNLPAGWTRKEFTPMLGAGWIFLYSQETTVVIKHCASKT